MFFTVLKKIVPKSFIVESVVLCYIINMVKIGIIGAMQVETKHLLSIMRNVKETKRANLVFNEGEINNKQVVLVQSGIGKVNAAICATILINDFKITHLINSGVAGGLNEKLHLFDIVVSSDVVHHDVDAVAFGYDICRIPGLETTYFPADKKLISIAKKAFEKGSFSQHIHEGRVATGDVFVNSDERKKYIKEICNPYCVEMEGAAIAQTCWLFSVPFVIIRCISDMAENTDEVYEEEKAAAISGFLVENMITLID